MHVLYMISQLYHIRPVGTEIQGQLQLAVFINYSRFYIPVDDAYHTYGTAEYTQASFFLDQDLTRFHVATGSTNTT